MKNNFASVDENIVRMQQLMGNTKRVVETKQQPLGIIEKVVKGKNGKTYAIVKENSNYYLKTSNKSADLSLNDFEYLGGSHRYKGLYEYKSYNQAEKILKEELINISMGVEKTETAINESARVDTNLTETVTSKEMRSEIDRIREIMENASKINKTGSGSVVISEQKSKINEVSLDDENIITDATEPETVDMDTEIPLDDEITPLDDEVLSDEEISPEGGLESKIDDLAAKLDPAIEKLDQLLSQYSPEEDVEELGDDEMIDIVDDEELGDETFDEDMGEHCDQCYDLWGDEFDQDMLDKEEAFYKQKIGESRYNQIKSTVLKKIFETISTIPGDVTKEKMDYEEAQPDSDGRTTFGDVSAEKDIDYESGFHQDTLGDVKSTANVSSLKGGGNIGGVEIEIVDDEKDSDLKTECGVIDNVSEGKMYYIVEKSGSVVGKIPAKNLKIK